MESRVLRLTITGSVVVHAAILLVASGATVSPSRVARGDVIEFEVMPAPTPAPAPDPPAPEPDAPADPAELEPALAPFPSVATPASARTSRPADVPVPAAPPATLDPAADAPPATPLLSMRTRTHTGTGDVETVTDVDAPGIPSVVGIAAAIVGDPGPPPEFEPFSALKWMDPRAPESELKPSGGGTHTAEDLVFTAQIGRDGRVNIDDKPNFQMEFAVPGVADLANHVLGWYEDPYGTAAADERAVETGTVTILRGGFDVTDWAMRMIGDDPYLQRKLQFLDRTRDERAQIAATNQAEDLRDAVVHLSDYLREIWAYTAWSAERRRAVIFELWDECAESGSDNVITAADEARATILGFVRRVLPEGSADAYSADELAALNAARTSKAAFAPY